MASIVACVTTSLTWCFCQACSSLLCACCGNDKPSTVPPSATSGRKRSVLVLLLSIGFALGFQYGLAPALVDMSVDNFIRDAWLDGCEEYGAFSDTEDLEKSCAGNNGNFRASAATTVFFLVAALAAAFKPTANREAWPAKYILYLFLVGVTVFIPNEPLFAAIFLNIARIGGAVFILAQQFIIVDLAYNWNDNWVTKSNEAEAEEIGSGQKWLYAILASCGLLYACSIGAFIYLVLEFTGCGSNNTFIALTLIFSVGIHAAQLSGEEGSLLSSSTVTAWAFFLCYTACSRNPREVCNPRVGEDETLTIAVGLIVTILSLGWTGWSYTAEDKLRVVVTDTEDATAPGNAALVTDEEKVEGEQKKVTGVVTGGNYGSTQEEEARDAEEDAVGGNDPAKLSNSWRLNIVLATVACWKSMILTHWGEISSEGTLANASASRTSMWMVIAAQWISLSLYLWTLVAPRLFPDRDFT